MAKKRNHNGAADGRAMAKPAEASAAYFLSLMVRNVRCFGDEPQTLDLSDGNGRPARWTVLLGNNGTGKTTLLQALALFEDPADELSGFLGRMPEFLRNDAKEGRLDAKVALGPTLHSLDHSAKTVELRCIVTPMGYRHDGNPPYKVPFKRYGYGSSRRFSLMGLPEAVAGDTTASLFSDDANLRNAEDWLLRLDYSASKPSKIQEQQKRHLAFVKALLIEILPEIEDIQISAGKGTNPNPKVEAKTPYGWVSLRQLGHGYRTLVAWMVDFVSRLVEGYPDNANPLEAPAVVLVDEIDLHMHPLWQRKLMSELTMRFPNTQFIVTAHSPLIVQAAAEDANIALLRREGDHVVIDNDMDYIRGWDVDMLLVSDLFGLPSSRPPQYDAIFERRKTLLLKSKRTPKEEQELARLNEKVYELPYGESADQAKTMELIQKTLKRLEERERQAQ